MYIGDDHHRVFGLDGQNVQFVGTQTESLPYVYYTPGYGYAQSPYNPYNPYIPGAVMAADGSYVVTQQYYMPSYENGTSSPMVVQPGLETYTSGTTDQYYDMSAASTASWVDPSGVNSNSFSAAGAYPMNSRGASNQTNGFGKVADGFESNGGHLNKFAANVGVTSNSVSGPASSQMLQGRGAQATGNLTNGRTASNYSQLKVTLPAANGVSNFGSSGNARVLVDKGRSKLPLVKVTNEVNETPNALTEQSRGPRLTASNAHLRVKARYYRAMDKYNKDDFPIDYVNAKFFVIKSYSEDDVHKSINYKVWSSTPNGNKKLNSAYEEAQKISVGDPKGCPIFLFSSVNASGQFCGVAEMTGPVDFHKDIDLWQQDKSSGSFPVKWHMIKDVPNPHFRHIILENNEHKPVTNSRDIQEIEYKKGLEVLKVFKSYTWKTSLFDDFMYYENRQKILQEEKARLLMRSSVTRVFVPFLHPPRKLNNFFDVASSGDEKSGKDNHIDTSDSNVSTFANGKPTEDDVLRFSSLAISPAQKETAVTGGATSVSAVSTTDSDNVLTVGSMPVNPKHNGFAESSGFLTVGTIPLDPKALKVKEASASAEIGLRKNSMEGVSVCDSSVNQPESEHVRPLPLTKEEITALNNFTVTFKHARSLFDVDLPTFKAKLMEFNILVWNEPDGIPLRIHGGDYEITIVINKISSYYPVKGTDSFSTVTNMIEYDLNLPPGGYELTYEQPQTSTYNLLKTDLDWHYAAEGSKLRGYFVRLNLNTNDEQTVALMSIYDESIRAHVHDSDYAPYDELPFYCLPNEDAYASLRAAYDEYASHEYSSDEYSSDDF